MVEAFARKVDSEITAVRRTFALRAEEDALEARSRFRSDSSASGGALIVDLREASLSNAGHHLSPAFSAEPTPKLRFDPLTPFGGGEAKLRFDPLTPFGGAEAPAATGSRAPQPPRLRVDSASAPSAASFPLPINNIK